MKKILLGGAVFLILLLTVSMKVKGNNPDTKRPDQEAAVKAAETKRVDEYRKKFSLKENFITDNPGSLSLNAKSAIIVNAENGEILFRKDDHQALPPASITKMLTGSVVLENLDIKKKLTVSKRAADMEPNKIVLKEGEKMKVDDLLFALFMISANDAAEVLAEGIDGKRETFLKKMGEKVNLLELKETSFKNPSGLDEEAHLSSAYDMAKITYYSLKEHPDIIKYAGRREDYSVFPTNENESHWWGNISSTLEYNQQMLAAKTGYTEEAGNTFIGVAKSQKGKYIFVFLGSSNGNEDAKSLLNYGAERMRAQGF